MFKKTSRDGLKTETFESPRLYNHAAKFSDQPDFSSVRILITFLDNLEFKHQYKSMQISRWRRRNNATPQVPVIDSRSGRPTYRYSEHRCCE